MAEAGDVAPDLAAQLAALRAQFTAQLGERLAALWALAAEDAATLSREQLRELEARLHQLAGAGGTFGQAELSRRAKALETALRPWLAAGVSVSPADWAAWRADLLALKAAVVGSDAPAAAPARVAKPGGGTRVALITARGEAAAELMRGLAQFGYEPRHFTTLAEAGPVLRAEPPDIALIELPARDEAAWPALAELRRAHGERMRLVVMAEAPDFALELRAAQAGGDACLALPVDAPSAAACIESLLGERDQPPVRVLIVDDDEAVAEHHRLLFAQAGMLAEWVSDPLAVRQALERLRPDVLLLDLHMPQCSGAELARAIRFDPAWQSLPILFLSAETDPQRQNQAVAMGADDFISKALGDTQLVAVVRSRAARSRKLSALMSQDSLTGLLKHATVKDRLAQEVDRANRQGKPLVVGMVDIDHFKQVNDGWGHPVGDQVIKTLGQLLRQRLRRQDSVGRYGGEEFMVLLPECSLDDAQRLLDDIRRRFGEVRFGGQENGFSVTFSAGIASNELARQAEDLLAVADAALYEAKRGGRDQVRRAGRPRLAA